MKENKNNNDLLLNKIQNYNDELNYELFEVINKYLSIIFNYLKYISDNKFFLNKNNNKYIISKGMDTINHIFKLILLYTKNIDLSSFHSQKAYFFYVEFIEQISQDSNIMLKLNSKDAIIFTYKKTIFELNNDYIKNIHKLTNNETKLINCLNNYFDIIISIVNYTIYSSENIYNTTIWNFLYDKLIFLFDLNKFKHDENIIISLYLLINKLTTTNINISNLFTILELFIQLTNKNNLTLEHLQHNIYITYFSSNDLISISSNIHNLFIN